MSFSLDTLTGLHVTILSSFDSSSES